MGVQVPRVWSAPPAVSSLGSVAVELAARAGLVLDPWQVFVLERGLGVREDGKFAAFEVGLNVARQNGKGGILEALELLWIFELGERLVIHSAHEFSTATVAMDRMEELLEEGGFTSELVDRGGVSRSHGSEGFKFKGRRRLWYRTRTKGGGRGFTCGKLVLDEAMVLPDRMIGALLPTMSALPNPQVVYAGSAVDQEVHDEGVVFARVRERGRRGDDPGLAYFEWSAPFEHPDEVPDEAFTDAGVWAQANPALGIRIREEHIEAERRSMDFRTFAAERLGVGDWPASDPEAERVIRLDVWDGLADRDSQPLDPVCFAFDVTPTRSRASIGVAGKRDDERLHVEVVENAVGAGWLVSRLVELDRNHQPECIVCDGAGPAASLVPELEAAGLRIVKLGATAYAEACGVLYDRVQDDRLRHLGQRELREALKGATTRPLGERWAWSRKSSRVDITPLVSCTLAASAAAELEVGPALVAFG